MGVNGEALQLHAVYIKKNKTFFHYSHTRICISKSHVKFQYSFVLWSYLYNILHFTLFL